MPLGISYFVLRLLQYVFDHLRGVITDNSFLRLAAFVMWIPTFPAGPLETYQGFYEKPQRAVRPPARLRGAAAHRARLLQEGLRRRLLHRDVLRHDHEHRRQAVLRRRARPTWWWPLAYVIIVFVRAYFDLSAYTDLAIGFSRLFGFRIMENFHYPVLEGEPGRVLARLAHLALELVPQQRLLPGVRAHAQAVARPVREHADHGPLALREPGTGRCGASGTAPGSSSSPGGSAARRRAARRARRRARRRRPATSAGRSGSGYPATFLYVALGYAFVSTETPRHALKILALCVWGPLRMAHELIGSRRARRRARRARRGVVPARLSRAAARSSCSWPPWRGRRSLLLGFELLVAHGVFAEVLRGAASCAIAHDDNGHVTYCSPSCAGTRRPRPDGLPLRRVGDDGVLRQRGVARLRRQPGGGRRPSASSASPPTRQSFAQSIALVENLPDGDALLAVGLAPMRFTDGPERRRGAPHREPLLPAQRPACAVCSRRSR